MAVVNNGSAAAAAAVVEHGRRRLETACPSCAVCPDFLNKDTTLTADCRMSGEVGGIAGSHLFIASNQSVVVRSEEGQKYTIYADGSHRHFYNSGTLELYNVRLTGGSVVSVSVVAHA